MGDASKEKSASIPSWQREQPKETESSNASHNQGSYQSTLDSEAPSRAALLEKAAKFLDDHEIKDAPAERKVSFLEGKGLKKDEIHELLSAPETKLDIAPVPEEVATEDREADAAQPNPDFPTSTKASQEPASRPSDGVPPIITYPEFLLHLQRPPPLITGPRLLTAAYVTSGAAALIYGTSKYIVEPMIQSLSSARHDLFEIASENLATLNGKLEDAVSIVPDDQKFTPDSGQDVEDLEASSFFNRSAGTQTSPQLSRSNSSASTPVENQPSATEKQNDRLQNLQGDLKGLLNPSSSEINGLRPDEQMRTNLDDFRRYLDGLAHGTAETVLGFSGSKSKEDGISKVKAEIRQTKGVLLSSRNFPSSVGTKGWGTA